MLKDDKTYPYIKVTASEEYPRILFSRQMKKDKNKYFGPFTSAGAVKEHNRADSEDIPDPGVQPEAAAGYGKGPSVPLLPYSPVRRAMSGVYFTGRLSEIGEAGGRVLNGQYEPVMKYLEEKMRTASETMEFEKAIEYRDPL